MLPKPSINESLIELHKVYDLTKIETSHSEAKPRTQSSLILPRSLFLPQPTKRKSKERTLPAYVLNSNSTNTEKIILAGFGSGRHRCKQTTWKLLLGNDVETNPGPGPNQDPNAAIQTFTYNVRGLGDEKKLRHLLNYFQTRTGGKNSDFICCLQETYVESPGKIPYLWRGNFQLTPGNGHSQGCITLLSPHLNIIANKNIESRGHVFACQKSGDSGITYIIANIYAPNPNSNEKIEFFNTVFDCISEFQERYNSKTTLLLGDFNLILKVAETRNRNFTSQEQRIAKIVTDLKDNNLMKDVWEDRAGFSWRRPNSDIFSTIDRIMYSKESLQLLKVDEIWSLSYSDHAAIRANFVHTEIKRNPRSRITRIDPSLSKSNWTKEKIETAYNEMMAAMPISWDPHKKLEYAKMCIRTVSEQTQAERKRKEASEEEAVNEELEIAIEALASGNHQANRLNSLIEHVESLRHRKEILIEEKGERLAEKLGTKWYNEGEKSTRYFLRLLQRTMPDDFTVISGVDGDVTEPELIEREIVRYYKSLYENYEKVNLEVLREDDDFFNELDSLSNDSESRIIEPLTLSELTETLHGCRDSAPGPDGIPYSILGLLWYSFGQILCDAWNHSLATGKLPPSHKVSYLKLIPKTGKELKELNNWRPITLSNCDHKIITKTYANRMSKQIAPLIRERQTAYLKGRLINDNIRSMLATVNITNLEERAKGLMVSLDAKKAFDSVEHSYIERCLKEIGCERFIKIFRLLYSDLTTNIMINGKIVNGFRILRGVKQGDSLSCIIFIICMEPMLRNIEANQDITRIKSDQLGQLPKTYAYADDVNCTISDNQESLQAVFCEYERLSTRSGLVLNADKTEIMTLGSDQPRNLEVMYLGKRYNLSSKEKIKVNGILLQRSYTHMVDDNIQVARSRMDKIFKSWSRRSLSTLGKILIVKTFGISQFIYLMQCVVLTSAHYKEINNLIYKFVWNRHYLASKAPERIKREIMNKPIKYGGYGMLDVVSLDESLKIRAIGRLLTSIHPFFVLLRGKCSLESFFEPGSPQGIEPMINKGLELLSKDRDKLWDNPNVERNIDLIGTIRQLELSRVLNRAGRLSIPYFLLRRRGVNTVGELSLGDLDGLSRFFEIRKINLLRLSVQMRIANRGTTLGSSIWTGNRFKPIASCSSKEIRESRSTQEPILEYKLGINLSRSEALSWGYRLTKLTSIKHRNVLLRLAHGEFYTKERLHRFRLIDSNQCPRCDMVETLQHKFIECEYVRRIWHKANTFKDSLVSVRHNQLDPLKATIGCYQESSTTSMTLDAEILLRISYLKDAQSYLIHPNILVEQCIKALIRKEKNVRVKEEIKTLLEN